MNYVSVRFWVFLAGFIVLGLLVRLALGKRWPKNGDKWSLFITSSALFALESIQSFCIFLAIGIWIYTAVIWVSRLPDHRKWTVTVFASFVALLPLAFYKYWSNGELGVIIPIGISFYTFQMIGFLVDSAKDRKFNSIGFGDFLGFASFFPQIVAGPIERKENLLPQLQKFRFKYDVKKIESGLRLIVLGFFYKLFLADNIAESSVWITAKTSNPWIVHYSNLVFGYRIYFDFCGYSMIAVGLGRILGIDLTENFRSPYTQRNIQDFWRNWHITLSRWFRDYVYIPLGGNRTRYSLLSIILVFLVSGIWHGAGINFVIWGVAHGAFFVVFTKLTGSMKFPALLSWGLTFFMTMSAWLFFYQTQTVILFDKISLVFRPFGYLEMPTSEFLRLTGANSAMLYSVVTTFLGSGVILFEWVSRKRNGSPYSWAFSKPIQMLLVILIVWMAPIADNGFVYFNF